MLAWTIVLGGAAWLGGRAMLERLQSEPSPVDPVPTSSVSDASDWASRQALLGAHIVDEYGESSSLVATCGSPRRDETVDEIHLRYLDAGMREAFDVRLESRGDTALASWRQLAVWMPPEPPPPDRSKAPQAVDDPRYATTRPETETDDHFQIASRTRRSIDAASWARALAAVRAPAFAQLPPGLGAAGHDGFVVIVESCLGGRYHLVKRWSPHGPEHAALLHTAREIEQAAGAVHAMPDYLSAEPTAFEVADNVLRFAAGEGEPLP
jgi:hypothetical protein